jgi:hypothetical protein
MLGADMELTGTAKYRGSKHNLWWFDRNKGVIGAVYSGVEDEMRCLDELLAQTIAEEEKKQPLDIAGVKKVLSRCIREVITNPKSQFQMLVGIGHPDINPLFQAPHNFFRVYGRRLAPAKNWEIIGRGDCELTRYLTSERPHPLRPHQALLWMVHVINLSKSFVHSVGQGIQIMIVSGTSKPQFIQGDKLVPKIEQAADLINDLWTNLSDIDATTEEFDSYLKNFSEEISSLRREFPKTVKE